MPDDTRVADMILSEMREGFAGVHRRLDLLNSKTAIHGEKIAVLEERTAVTSPSRKKEAGVVATVSAAFTLVVAEIVPYFVKWIKAGF